METVKSGVDLSGDEQHLLSLHEQLFHGSRTQQAFEAERLSTVNTSNKCSAGAGAAQNTVQVLKTRGWIIRVSAPCSLFVLQFRNSNGYL